MLPLENASSGKWMRWDPPYGPIVKGNVLPSSSVKLSTRMRRSRSIRGATQSECAPPAPPWAPTGRAESCGGGTQLCPCTVCTAAPLPTGAHTHVAPVASASPPPRPLEEPCPSQLIHHDQRWPAGDQRCYCWPPSIHG